MAQSKKEAGKQVTILDRRTYFANKTIYTLPSDTWSSLQSDTYLTREELIILNPHLDDVETIEPGIPIDVPVSSKPSLFSVRAASSRTALEAAQDELAIGVREIPGRRNNQRIVMYHASTAGGAAPDEVPWCSSFVNWCVEQAGKTGTDSKAARSWKNWGSAVPRSNWRRGDIIVFWQESPTSSKGHVGFLWDFHGHRPMVLGGNQGDKVCIDDPLPFRQVLTVRRG